MFRVLGIEYDGVYNRGDDVPDQFDEWIRPEVVEGLGKPLNLAFPAFTNAFPRTASAMEKYWPQPVLAVKTLSDVTIAWLISETARGCLIFEMLSPYSYINEKLFEEWHGMLPPRWRELYRFFNSFSIKRFSKGEDTQEQEWNNALFQFSSRPDISEYCAFAGIKKTVGREFRQKIESLCVRCWLWTEAGDALFIDEAKNDQKVYHVRNSDFSDYHILDNAEDVLDCYLAHYVAGGDPNAFDFRASVV